MADYEYVYIIGYLGDNDFYLWDYNSTSVSYEEAKDKLVAAYKKNPNASGYKIYKIKVSDMVCTETDKSLSDFDMLRNKLKLGSFWWSGGVLFDTFGERQRTNAYTYREIKFNQKNNTATIDIKYNFSYTRFRTHELFNKICNQLEKQFEYYARYAMIPEIKTILKENDMHIRVEFKINGTKLIKGFITKE